MENMIERAQVETTDCEKKLGQGHVVSKCLNTLVWTLEISFSE